MAAAAANRSTVNRQPSELVAYTGSSTFIYYQGTMIMRDGTGTFRPAVVGAGASSARFEGVMENYAPGTTVVELRLWKTGEFTFESNGTGATSHIGQRAYIIDDQTVGLSAAFPCLVAGEITGLPTTTQYRVRIDGAVGLNYQIGLSGFTYQN